MTPTLLLLAVTLAQVPAFEVTTIRPDGGPELLVQSRPGPLVALRLSAPVDPSVPEGGVALLQELARPDATATARRFGARLAFRRDGDHAIIAVTGPARAFDALATLLRSTTADPDLSVSNLRRARARASDRVLAELEQPEPRIRRLLRHRLFGGRPPAGPAATTLAPEEIRGLRARVYDPARIRVTVVGSIPEPALRAGFGDWPRSPGGAGALVRADGTAERARPQAHREWAGLGYRTPADPAVLAVTAELIRQRIDRSPLRSGATHTWRGPDGWALVLVGATEPGDSVVRVTAGIGRLPVAGAGPAGTATGVGRYLRRMIAEAAALIGPDAVIEARTGIRRRLLLEARTPTGRAEAIGRLVDALGPEGGPAFLAAVERVEWEAVRETLDRLLAMPATYVEAR